MLLLLSFLFGLITAIFIDYFLDKDNHMFKGAIKGKSVVFLESLIKKTKAGKIYWYKSEIKELRDGRCVWGYYIDNYKFDDNFYGKLNLNICHRKNDLTNLNDTYHLDINLCDNFRTLQNKKLIIKLLEEIVKKHEDESKPIDRFV